MNEIVKVPSKKIKTNPFNYNILFLFVIFFIFKGSFSNKKVLPNITSFFNSFKTSVNNNIQNLDTINIYDIRKKVDVLMKAAPYLPEQVVFTVNKIYPYYEKFNAIISLVEFIKSSNPSSLVIPMNKMTQKDKVKQIMNIVTEEIPNSKIASVTPIVDLVLQADKFKGILNMFSSGDTKKKNNNSLENIISSLGSVLGGGSESTNEKMKDILPMMEILKVLMSSDNEKEEA